MSPGGYFLGAHFVFRSGCSVVAKPKDRLWMLCYGSVKAEVCKQPSPTFWVGKSIFNAVFGQYLPIQSCKPSKNKLVLPVMPCCGSSVKPERTSMSIKKIIMKYRGQIFFSVLLVGLLVAAYLPMRVDNVEKETVLMRAMLTGFEQLHYQPK